MRRPRLSPKPLLHAACVVVFALAATAQAEIHKCLVDGKVIYTDQACAEQQTLPFQLTELNRVSASAVSYTGSLWLSDSHGYRTATEAGITENVPVFIYVYTDWCGYCKKLEQVYLADPAVQATLAKFIKLKLNPEHSADNDTLFERWGGRGYPSLYVQYPGQGPQKIPQPFTQRNGQWVMLGTETFIGMLAAHLRPFEKKPEVPPKGAVVKK